MNHILTRLWNVSQIQLNFYSPLRSDQIWVYFISYHKSAFLDQRNQISWVTPKKTSPEFGRLKVTSQCLKALMAIQSCFRDKVGESSLSPSIIKTFLGHPVNWKLYRLEQWWLQGDWVIILFNLTWMIDLYLSLLFMVFMVFMLSMLNAS